MKRVVTVLLLAIFLLNVVGYYGILVGLQLSFQRDLQAQFDEDQVSASNEIVFNIPLALPYATDAKDFQRVDGEFEYQGEVYRLVKQKLASDTLTIVCIRDVKAKGINQALEDYVKTFSDKPSNAKGALKTLENFSKDFVSQHIAVSTAVAGWNMFVEHTTALHAHYQFQFIDSLTKPPRA